MRAEVRQFVMFPITPDVLHRIEFRSVGWQVVQRQAAALAGDKFPHQPAAMGLRAIPHHQQLARQVAQQMTQEVDYFGSANGSFVRSEIEIPPSDASDGREHLPVEMILQHRGLSARSPGAHPMGPLAQPALVDKDDGAPLAERFFLSRGQRTRFQYRMASSSRSSARPVGRWHAFPKLVGAQFGLTPGPPGLLQTRPTGLRELPNPANHRLPMDAQAPRPLPLAHALLEQLRGCHPPPFQSLKVPPHTRCITHSSKLSYVSILCKGQ